jgi:hypothetical protein
MCQSWLSKLNWESVHTTEIKRIAVDPSKSASTPSSCEHPFVIASEAKQSIFRATKSKHFFFEKKKQKTFTNGGRSETFARSVGRKSAASSASIHATKKTDEQPGAAVSGRHGKRAATRRFFNREHGEHCTLTEAPHGATVL